MEHALSPSYCEVYDEKTLDWLKKEFARTRGEHYVDHAGATLYADSQIRKISEDFASSLYANPHSAAGNLTAEIVERTRHRILDLFNAPSQEYSLIFTSGATAALKCVAETFDFGDRGDFVYLESNHTSVLGMRDVAAGRGAKVTSLGFHEAFDAFRSKKISLVDLQCESNSLFVYPAQCNFSGVKYPLGWIQGARDGALNGGISRWYVLLDAAGFVGTSKLDLAVHKPDFVVMSFYKMFGYPTGIGALIVRNSSASVLEKVYYGGGTVNVALSSKNFHVKREIIHERFEDGTVPFLSIISLQHGLDTFEKIPLSQISTHVFHLARYLYHSLVTLHHVNGAPVVIIYADTDYEDINNQGGTVTFNVLRSTGEYVGYMEVLHMAALFKIHLRTGCFCNPGACQRHLILSNQDVLQNYDAGYKCGGGKDIINGRPTGAVRVSFGYMSDVEDVETLLLMIRKCFLDGPEVRKLPQWYGVTLRKRNRETERQNTSVIINIDKIKTKDTKTIENLIVENRTNGINESSKLILSKLYIYPVKSCAAYEVLDSWKLTTKGLLYDREWMIVSAAGVCLTQKQDVNLCLVKPTICLQKNVMKLEYPGMPSTEVALEYTAEEITAGEMCRSRVCGHRVEGIDCGTEVSEWLSLALGRPNLRLIRQFGAKETVSSGKPELSFSSQAQYLLINNASVQWLVDRIPEGSDCDKATVLHRFRGNMIVKGGVPFEEEKWGRVAIGQQAFEVMGACTRCQMVCIDQQTGIKTVEPLRLLAEEFHGKLKFGIYLTRNSFKSANIRIGDSLTCM